MANSFSLLGKFFPNFNHRIVKKIRKPSCEKIGYYKRFTGNKIFRVFSSDYHEKSFRPINIHTFSQKPVKEERLKSNNRIANKIV